MLFAEWDKIVEIGWPAMFKPPTDVMYPTCREPDGAIGVNTTAIHRPQRSTLGPASGPFRTPNIKDLTVTAKHGRQHLGVATHPSDRRHWQVDTVLSLTNTQSMQPCPQGLPVDQHSDLRNPATTVAVAGMTGASIYGVNEGGGSERPSAASRRVWRAQDMSKLSSQQRNRLDEATMSANAFRSAQSGSAASNPSRVSRTSLVFILASNQCRTIDRGSRYKQP